MGGGLSAAEVGPCAPPGVRKAGRAPAVTGAMAGLLPLLGLLPVLSVLPPRGEWGRDRGEPSLAAHPAPECPWLKAGRV